MPAISSQSSLPRERTPMTDNINPNHYRNPSGVQLIECVRFLPFDLGNALKYVYRHNDKGTPQEDLKKALWYLSDFTKNPVQIRRRDFAKFQKHLDEVFDGVDKDTKRACMAIVDVCAAATMMDRDSLQDAVEHAVEEVSSLVFLRA